MTRNERQSHAETIRHALHEVYDPQPAHPAGWSEHSCDNCRCTRADIHAAGGRCPRTVPTTEPGLLHDTREVKALPHGFWIALLAVPAVVALVGIAAVLL